MRSKPSPRRLRQLLTAWRVWILAALLVASVISAFQRSAPDQDATDRPLRLGINLRLEGLSQGEVEKLVAEVAGAGFRWVRVRFPWEMAQPSPGGYDWAAWDAWIDAAAAHDLTIIAVLDRAPAWARERPEAEVSPPLDAATFGSFVCAFARRYGDHIDYYQIWDEPNIQAHWAGPIDARRYVTLLREGAVAVRTCDPIGYVLSAALAPTLEETPWNLNEIRFLREMYRAGASPWFDILAAQPFGFERPPEEAPSRDRLNARRVELLRAEMRRAGDEHKPVWGVRFGWYADRGPTEEAEQWHAVTAEQQTAWTQDVLDRARLEWPWLGALFWPTWWPLSSPEESLAGFALVDDGATTPVLEALTENLADPPLVLPGRYDLSHPALEWHGAWRRAAGRADVGRTGDTLRIPFYGTGLDLATRRGPYWAWLEVTVDGKPANALPRDPAGRAYVVLHDPRGRAEWVTLASGLELGAHVATLVAHGGWGQWALEGIAVRGPERGGLRWPSAWMLALMAALVAAWAAQALLRRLAYEGAPPRRGLAVLAALLAWGGYAAAPWPWSMIPLAVYAMLVGADLPVMWGLSAFWIPFYYVQKPRGDVWVPHFEAAVVAAWWGALAWRRITLRRWRDVDSAVLAFVLWGLLASWFAYDRAQALQAWHVNLLTAAAWYLLLRVAARGEMPARWVSLGALAGGAAVASWGLWEYARGIGVTAQGILRLQSIYYSPNEVALLLVRLWPIALFLAWEARRWRRAAAIGITVLMLAALSLTFSRGAWFLGVTVAIAGVAQRLQRRWLILGGGVALIALIVAVSRGLDVSSRWLVWRAAWALWQDHPWMGVGLNQFQWWYPRYMSLEAWQEPLLYHPHNVILELLTATGGVGLLLAGLTATLWARALSRRWPVPPLLSGWIIGCAAGLAYSLVDAWMALPDLTWLTLTAIGLTVLDPSERRGDA